MYASGQIYLKSNYTEATIPNDIWDKITQNYAKPSRSDGNQPIRLKCSLLHQLIKS